MRSILCYGDSNTWGFVPGTYETRERYNLQTRWTGRLQQLLGTNDFHVIEEGLNGRTTNLDYTYKWGYRGTELLPVILYTHAPLDLVVIMLGINDLKKEFHNRTSEDITSGIKELIDIVLSTNYGSDMQKPPSVLIVSTPIPVNTQNKSTLEIFEHATDRMQNLADHLKVLVDTYDTNVYFVDAASHVQLSPVDGIHFDEKAHDNFALLIKDTIRKIFINKLKSL